MGFKFLGIQFGEPDEDSLGAAYRFGQKGARAGLNSQELSRLSNKIMDDNKGKSDAELTRAFNDATKNLD